VIVFDAACVSVGGSFEVRMYGCIAKASMIGFVRPLALYAAPRSRMNCVGECVSRFRPGRSDPRGARPPPITFTCLFAALSAS
jgi:hypothetical protein